MTDWLHLLGGALLLYFGAEWFVRGASALALALRVPKIMVGLTVVAYGTSAPELVVGMQAARTGHGPVALGNVIGSNVANVGLILALAVLVRPAQVDGSLRRREVPALLLSAGLVPVLMLDGLVSAIEGCVLLALAIGYTAWMVASTRASQLRDARTDAQVTSSAADAAGGPRARGSAAAVFATALGLGVLLIGGQLFVLGAVAAARRLGMSDRLVGLSIVAVGTSLPELVTSLIAARRGHADIAIGNVVGSNIFNVLLCLGATALVRPIEASIEGSLLDVGALLVMTALAARCVRHERVITRAEGALALALYAVFCSLTFARG